MSYRLSNHAVALRDWVNGEYPNRDKRSDGWISSDAHKIANPRSDHDPRRSRYTTTLIVRALDIDADLNAEGRREAAPDLAEALRRKHKKWGISYIIYNGRIASAKSAWRWRKYTGTNPHKAHIHVSFLERPGE